MVVLMSFLLLSGDIKKVQPHPADNVKLKHQVFFISRLDRYYLEHNLQSVLQYLSSLIRCVMA